VLAEDLRYWEGINDKAMNMYPYLCPQEHQVILGVLIGSFTMHGKE